MVTIHAVKAKRLIEESKVDRFAWINLLYDFYGPLLTDRQRLLLEYYYEQDLSLGEIAADLGISRQAVHDTVKRSEDALERFERKLGLAARYLAHKNRIEKARAKRQSLTMMRRSK